jgi:hypothetical protein
MVESIPLNVRQMWLVLLNLKGLDELHDFLFPAVAA